MNPTEQVSSRLQPGWCWLTNLWIPLSQSDAAYLAALQERYGSANVLVDPAAYGSRNNRLADMTAIYLREGAK